MKVNVRVVVSHDIEMEIDDRYKALADDDLRCNADGFCESLEYFCIADVTDKLYEKYPDISLDRVVLVEDEDGNPLVEW